MQPSSAHVRHHAGRAALTALILVISTAAHANQESAAPRPPDGPAYGANVVQNGDFTRGFGGWTLEQAPGTASARLELPAGQQPPGVSGGVARIVVSAIG